jgi:hypothetical protein
MKDHEIQYAIDQIFKKLHSDLMQSKSETVLGVLKSGGTKKLLFKTLAEECYFFRYLSLSCLATTVQYFTDIQDCTEVEKFMIAAKVFEMFSKYFNFKSFDVLKTPYETGILMGYAAVYKNPVNNKVHETKPKTNN